MKVANALVRTLEHRIHDAGFAPPSKRSTGPVDKLVDAPAVASLAGPVGQDALAADRERVVASLEAAYADPLAQAAGRLTDGIARLQAEIAKELLAAHAVFFGEHADDLIRLQGVDQIVMSARTLEGTALSHLVTPDEARSLLSLIPEPARQLRGQICALLNGATGVTRVFPSKALELNSDGDRIDLKRFFANAAYAASLKVSGLPLACEGPCRAIAEGLEAGKPLSAIGETKDLLRVLDGHAIADMVRVLLAWEPYALQPVETLPTTIAQGSSPELGRIGDFEIRRQTGTVRLVTKIEHTRGWSRGNPGLSDPHLSQPVSYPIETPVIAELSPRALAKAIASDPILLTKLHLGGFEEVIASGLLSPTLPAVDVPKAARARLAAMSTELDTKNNEQTYGATRVMVARAALDPTSLDIAKGVAEAKSFDWLPTWGPAHIALAMTGKSSDVALALEQGEKQASIDDRRNIIAGWSILAGAHDEARKPAYFERVMRHVDTDWLDMRSQVLTAAALLAPEDGAPAIFARAERQFATARRWETADGALVAMALTAPTASVRRAVFSQGVHAAHRQNAQGITTGLIVMAVAASSDNERQLACSLAEQYSTSAWNQRVRGSAALALGILASPTPEVARRIAAAAIHDPTR